MMSYAIRYATQLVIRSVIKIAFTAGLLAIAVNYGPEIFQQVAKYYK